MDIDLKGPSKSDECRMGTGITPQDGIIVIAIAESIFDSFSGDIRHEGKIGEVFFFSTCYDKATDEEVRSHAGFWRSNRKTPSHPQMCFVG